MKKCTKCGEVKILSDYHKLSRNKDGHNSKCKSCVLAHTHKYRKDNPTQYKATKTKTEAKRAGTRYDYHKELVRLKVEENPTWHMDNFRRSKYGIEESDFWQLVENQKGICPICENRYEEGRVPVVDHDHRCEDNKGRGCRDCIRGVICSKCNVMLGFSKDNKDTLIRAAKYLEQYHDQ